MSNSKSRLTAGLSATLLAAGLFAGIGAGVATAETPQAANGCSAGESPNDGAMSGCHDTPPPSKKELKCYEKGAVDGAVGALKGPVNAGRGAAYGCAKELIKDDDK